MKKDNEQIIVTVYRRLAKRKLLKVIIAIKINDNITMPEREIRHSLKYIMFPSVPTKRMRRNNAFKRLGSRKKLNVTEDNNRKEEAINL